MVQPQHWSQNLHLQRLLVIGMFGCIAWAFGEMLLSFGASWPRAVSTALLALFVFSAGVTLGGREATRHYRRYSEYSLIDWVLLLVPIVLSLKLLPDLLAGPDAVASEVARWLEEPWRFWDLALVWSLLMIFLVWDFSVRVAEELSRLAFQPGEPERRRAAAGAAGAASDNDQDQGDDREHHQGDDGVPRASGHELDPQRSPGWIGATLPQTPPPPPATGLPRGGLPDLASGALPPGAYLATGRSSELAGTAYRFVSHTRAWQRLMSSFYLGGFVLLIFAGLTLVDPADLGNPNRAEVTGVVPSVILYYLLGLILASQTSLNRLRAGWLREGATVQLGLARRWLAYGSALMLGALLLSLLLPTSFTNRAADELPGLWGRLWIFSSPFQLLLGPIFGALNWLISHLLAVLLAPLSGLLPQGAPDTAPAPVPRPAAPSTDDSATLPPASSFVWAALFYVLPVAIAAYALWNTWQKRHAIWQGLRTFTVDVKALIWGAVLDLVALLWRFVGSASPRLLAAAPEQIKQRWRKRRRRAAGGDAGRSNWLRLRDLAPRALIVYFYTSLVQRAGDAGWERRRGQTAYEYSRDLAGNLPDRKAELEALTDAFVRARYSPHPVAGEDARRARLPWQRIRDALQTRRRANTVASWFGFGREG